MRNELMIFEGHQVEVLELNGEVLFNPYHVGECLELAESSVRNYLAKMNNKQAVLLKNSDVRDKDIRKLNNAGEKFITESGVYKLVFKSHKPNAEEFTDWIADEVLPALRQTGSYEIPREEKKQPNQVESLTIKEVKFLDDVLRVGQDKQGRIFVGVNDICKALGMNKARKDKEIIAVQKDETLKKGCKKFSSGAFYWFGSAITLQLDYIPLWLTKIKITPSMRVNNPNAANKLVEYQSQAKDVLAAAFFANNTLITYPPALSHYTASAVAELGRITKSIMEKQGSSPRKIAEIFKLECQQFGIYLPEDFVEMPIYEQLSLDINEIITR